MCIMWHGCGGYLVKFGHIIILSASTAPCLPHVWGVVVVITVVVTVTVTKLDPEYSQPCHMMHMCPLDHREQHLSTWYSCEAP